MVALSAAHPLSGLSESTRLRFSYACIMARRSRTARRAFAAMLRRNLGGPPQDDLWLAYTAWCFGALSLSARINRRTEARAAASAEAAIAQREADFAETILHGTLRPSLAACIDAISLAPSSPLILVPLSSRYMELFNLWKRQVERHAGAGTLLVLAMDGPARDLLAAAGALHVDLSSYFGFDASLRLEDYSKRHLWVLRVLVLQELLARGHSVLSLDLDAVLVGALPPLLASLPAADIVVQKDYSIPVDAARTLGFTLCCGFLWMRPAPAVDAFLQRYAEATALELDDQTALNHLVAENGVLGKVKTEHYLSFHAFDLLWVLPDPAYVSRDISRGTVIRHFQQNIPLGIDELTRRLGLS